MARWEPGVRHVGSILEVAYDRDIKYPAAAIAYYTFVSLVPILMLGFAGFGRRFAAGVEGTTTRYLTPAAQELFLEALVSVSGRAGGVILSVAILVWTGANVAIGFGTAIDRIEGVVDEPNLDRARRGVVVLGSLVTAGGVVSLSVLVTAIVDGGIVAGLVGPAVLLVALTVVFVPLYYAPSRVVDTPRAALPGAVVAATGWTALHLVVQLYVGLAPRYAIYGALSGIVILLTSLYAATMLLLLGAIVNWSYSLNRA